MIVLVTCSQEVKKNVAKVVVTKSVVIFLPLNGENFCLLANISINLFLFQVFVQVVWRVLRKIAFDKTYHFVHDHF